MEQVPTGDGGGGAQVMRLREENENLMNTVVRTKIELAETQGVLPLRITPRLHFPADAPGWLNSESSFFSLFCTYSLAGYIIRGGEGVRRRLIRGILPSCTLSCANPLRASLPT